MDNRNIFPGFSAMWDNWQWPVEYEIFDAIDDWLINGKSESVACRRATARMSYVGEFFTLADCLAAAAESMSQ